MFVHLSLLRRDDEARAYGDDCERRSLNDAAVSTQWREVAWRVEEPEAFPFVDDHAEVFTSEQQLLDTAFRSSGVDWQEATDRSRQAYGQDSQLQDAAHRGFLHERWRHCIQRSVRLKLNLLWKSIGLSVICRLDGPGDRGAVVLS